MRKPACLINMACCSHQFVRLLVFVAHFLRSECFGTRAEGQSLRQRSRLSNLLGDTLRTSNTACFRLCRSMMKNQEKQRIFTLENCIQDCEQGMRKDTGNDHHTPRNTRKLRSIEKPNRCLGLSDPTAANFRQAEILNVTFKSIAAHKHSYTVSWKPLQNIPFVEGGNLTHYSLLYEFAHNPTPNGMMRCVLVPRNVTHWTITDQPPNIKPDTIDVAVVSFPFRGTHFGGAIPLQRFDPLRPDFIPTFMPVFQTKEQLKEEATKPISWTAIAGGSVAGVVLLVIVLTSIVWRRRSTLCPLNYQDPVIPAAISRPNNVRESVTEIIAAASPSGADISSEVYYSCYYPENEAFRGEVASIVNFFRENGYEVIMDAMMSSELNSQGPTRWAENQIRKAKKVLVFLSPSLLSLASADGREGNCNPSQDINRVWMELEVLRDLYTRNRSAAKMVGIELPGLPVKPQDLPVWLKNSYKWPKDVQEILKRLNDRPSIEPGQRYQ